MGGMAKYNGVRIRQAEKYEKNDLLEPNEKAKAWELFLQIYAENNPNSDKDETLRRKAKLRQRLWEMGGKRFGTLHSGIIFDIQNRLEWYVGPDKNTNWNEAKSWVASLNVGGGGWRMPTRAELKSLYQKKVGPRKMDPVFKTTGWWVWSGEAKDSSSAWLFDFNYGYEDWNFHSNYYYGRAFAVRAH